MEAFRIGRTTLANLTLSARVTSFVAEYLSLQPDGHWDSDRLVFSLQNV